MKYLTAEEFFGDSINTKLAGMSVETEMKLKQAGVDFIE
jgi:hypothetical protein